MSGSGKGIAGLLIGAAIGAGVTYLVTSGKGKDLLKQLKKEADKLKKEADKLKEKVTDEAERLKGDLVEKAKKA